MNLRIFATSKTVRDDIKTEFPSIGILNDFHQMFDIVFTDEKLMFPVTQWCLDHGHVFEILQF